MVSEREFVMLIETLIQEKYKNIYDEDKLSVAVVNELKTKFSAEKQ